MDPDATLRALLDAFGDGDIGTARTYAQILSEWLDKGGALPADPRRRPASDALTHAERVMISHALLRLMRDRILGNGITYSELAIIELGTKIVAGMVE